MTTMKEAIVSAGPKVEIKESPIPEPGPDDVIIKVVVSGYVLYSVFLYQAEGLHDTLQATISLLCFRPAKS